MVDFHRDSIKIWSKPAGWVEQHVRADQATFRKDIEGCGFEQLCGIHIDSMKDHYEMVFLTV